MSIHLRLAVSFSESIFSSEGLGALLPLWVPKSIHQRKSATTKVIRSADGGGSPVCGRDDIARMEKKRSGGNPVGCQNAPLVVKTPILTTNL